MAQQESSKLVDLTELAYLRRLAKYQERKRDHIEHRLQCLVTSCGARNRIVDGAKDLEHELVDAIQSTNRTKFSSLYHTFHLVKQACDEWDAQIPISDGTSSISLDQAHGSFLDGVSPDARNSLLVFLSNISFNASFLLGRLLGLSDHDFAPFARPYSRGPAIPHFPASPLRRHTDDADNESLRKFLDFSRSSPLALLLRLIPEPHTAPNGPHNSAWGTICAGLLSQQKPGSDKFVITVMNAHLGQLGRTARHYMENWILETLRDGHFILCPVDKRPLRTRTHSVSGNNVEISKLEDDFFSQAIEKLLRILKDNRLTGIIPTSILGLGKSIVANLEPSSQQQLATPYFLCTRWLFASYLSSLITSPESYGLLLSHFISSAARQRILHELAHRLQRIMEGVAYSWKQASSIVPNVVADIESIVSLFRWDPMDTTQVSERLESTAEVQPVQERNNEHDRQVTLCASEVLNSIRAIFPEIGSNVFYGLHDGGSSALRSSASSISGLSLFRPMSPIEPSSPPNGYYGAVPSEVGAFNENPYYGTVSKEPPTNDCLHLAEDTFVHRLREAYAELAIAVGYDLNTGNCDLFSERWTSLEGSLDSGKVSWTTCLSPHLGYASSATNGDSDLRVKQRVDLVTLDFISSGIHTLLNSSVSPPDLSHRLITQDANALHNSLIDRFESSRANCYHQGDFAQAHLFFRLAKATKTMSPEITAQTVQAVARNLQQSIDTCHLNIQDAGVHMEKLSEKIELQQIEIQSILHNLDRLREKMWYAADIQRAGHYEDLRKVAVALRVMATSPRPKADKKQPLLRRRSTSRSLHHTMQLKAEAATLDLLSAPVDKGGINKLSDVQIEMTLRWMEMHGVERVCRAEERIHRFCFELTKCLDHFVGHSISENPILWSSELFQNERPPTSQINPRSNTPNTDRRALDHLRSLYTNSASKMCEAQVSHWNRAATPSRVGVYANLAPRSLSPRSVTHDYFACQSPTLTHKSSGTLCSTFSGGPQSPSSATSFPSRALSPVYTGRPLSRHSCLQQSRNTFLEELRQNLTSLLLSDFHDIFRSGSETDEALRKPHKIGLPTNNATSDTTSHENAVSQHLFDFEEVFRMLLNRFELQASPYVKLDILLELQSMLKAHRIDSGLEHGDSLFPSAGLFSQRSLNLRIDPAATPRTSSGHDSTILSFRQLFQNQNLRPKTLFRDLQYIASLVPLHMLDSTARGRAFWNATIAALDVKEEICQGMIETADQIINQHTFSRGHSGVTSAAQAKRDAAAAFSPSSPPRPSDSSIADLSMSDAATLLQFTAKEGIPAAQRELATLYLTHPELLGICTSPFAKAKDVFGHVDKDREGLSQRYDPVAMAVARHWMQLSAEGGDGPAVGYLKAKDEFDRIP